MKDKAKLQSLSDDELLRRLSELLQSSRRVEAELREMLLGRATHKTKRQIEELIAEIAPKPDVPSTEPTTRALDTPESKAGLDKRRGSGQSSPAASVSSLRVPHQWAHSTIRDRPS